MTDYSKVTMIEYQKKKVEMLNDLGRTGCECADIDVDCGQCPLRYTNFNCTCGELELLNTEKALEIVMEYEPKVDWSKVSVDTKILVRNNKTTAWICRYFAEYDERRGVKAYVGGRTSFTAVSEYDVFYWKYAKLYKETIKRG